MSFEFHINGNQTTFFILFVLRSCTFGFADYTYKGAVTLLMSMETEGRKYRPRIAGDLSPCPSRGLAFEIP